ncbi:hypothetical protein JCM21900_005367 [Sporobolomyces salmonicolor]
MSQPMRLKSWFATIERLEGLTVPGIRLYGLLDAEEAEGTGGEVPVRLDLVERLADARFRGVVEGKERIVELLGAPELERARAAGVPEMHLKTFANGIPSHLELILQAAACSRVDLSVAFPPTPSTSTTRYPLIQDHSIDIEDDVETLPSSLFDLGTGCRLDEGAPKTRHELAQALRDVKGKARARDDIEEEPVHFLDRDEGYVERDDEEADEEDRMEVDERELEPVLDGQATSTPSADVDVGEMVDPGSGAPVKAGQPQNADQPDDAPPRPAPSPVNELSSSHAPTSPSSPSPRLSSPLRLTTVLSVPTSILSSRIVAASTKIAIHALVSDFFAHSHGDSLHSSRPSRSSLLVFSRREQDLLDAVSRPAFKSPSSDQGRPDEQASGQGEISSTALVMATSVAGTEQRTEVALLENRASPSSIAVLPNGELTAVQLASNEEDVIMDVEGAVEKDAEGDNEASAVQNAVEKVPSAGVEDQRHALLTAPPEAGLPVEAELQPAQEVIEMIDIEEASRSSIVHPPSPNTDVLGPVQLPPPLPAVALSDRHSSLEPLPHPTSSFASLYEDSDGGDSVDFIAKELAEFVERDALGLASSEPDDSYKTVLPDKTVSRMRSEFVEMALEKVEKDAEEQEGDTIVPESPRQSPSPRSEETPTSTRPPSAHKPAEPLPEPVLSPVVINDPAHHRSQSSSSSSYATALTDSTANNASAALLATPAPSPRPHPYSRMPLAFEPACPADDEEATAVTEPVEENEPVEEMEHLEHVEEIGKVEQVEEVDDAEQAEHAAIYNRSYARKALADSEDPAAGESPPIYVPSADEAPAPIELPSPFLAAQLPPLSITEADEGSGAALPLDREATAEPQPQPPALQAEPAEIVQDAVNDLTQEVTGEVVGQVVGGLVDQVAGEAIGEVIGTVAGDVASVVVEGSGVVEGVSSALERAVGINEEAAEKKGAEEANGEEQAPGVEDEVQGEKEADGEEEAPTGDVVEAEFGKQDDFFEASDANGCLGENEESAGSIVEAPPVAALDQHAPVSPVEQPAPLPLHHPGSSPTTASERDDEARRIARSASDSNARVAMAALKALRNETTSPDLDMSYHRTDDFGGGGDVEDEERLPECYAEAFPSATQAEEQKYDVFGPVDVLPNSNTPAHARLRSSSAKSSRKPSPIPAASSEPAQPPPPSFPAIKQLKRRRSIFLGVEIVVSPKRTPSPKKTFKYHAAQFSSADPVPRPVRASTTSRPSEHPCSRSHRSWSPPPPTTAKPTPDPSIAYASTSFAAPVSSSSSTSLIAAVGRSFWDDAPAKTSRRSPLKYGARRSSVRSAQENPIDAGHSSSDALALSPPRTSKTRPKPTPKPKAPPKPAPAKKQQTAQDSRKGKGKAIVQAKEFPELDVEPADAPLEPRKQPNPPQAQVEVDEPSDEEIIARLCSSKGKGKVKAVVSDDEGEGSVEDDEELRLFLACVSPSVSRKRPAPAPGSTTSPSRKSRKTRQSPPPAEHPSKGPTAPRTPVQPSSSFSSRKSRLAGLAQSRHPPATPANNHAGSAVHGAADSLTTASGRPSRTRKPVEGWWEVQRGLESVARAHRRPRTDSDNEDDNAHGEETPYPAAAVAPSPQRRKKARTERRVVIEELDQGERDDQHDDSTNGSDKFEGDEPARDDEEGEEPEEQHPEGEDEAAPKPPSAPAKRRKKRKSITLPRSRHRKPAVTVAANANAKKQQSLSRASEVKKARGRSAGPALLAGRTTTEGGAGDVPEWTEGDEGDGLREVHVARETDDDDGYGFSD